MNGSYCKWWNTLISRGRKLVICMVRVSRNKGITGIRMGSKGAAQYRKDKPVMLNNELEIGV